MKTEDAREIAQIIADAITKISHGDQGIGSSPLGLEAISMSINGGPFDFSLASTVSDMAGSLGVVATSLDSIADAIIYLADTLDPNGPQDARQPYTSGEASSPRVPYTSPRIEE